jgi:ribosome-binding protein aMBF1 (putative translation factor)
MKSTNSTKTSTHEEVWAKIEASYTAEDLRQIKPLKAIVAASTFRNDVAKLIKAKREALDMNQRDFAKYLGISQRDVSHLEQAKGNPTISTLSVVFYMLDIELTVTQR